MCGAVWRRQRIEEAPGVAGFVEDVGVGFEDGVGEPVLAQILPDVFDAVKFGRVALARRISVRLGGTLSRTLRLYPAPSSSTAAWAPWATCRLMVARCSFML